MTSSIKEAILYAVLFLVAVFLLADLTIRQETMRIDQINLHNDNRNLEERITNLERVFIQNKQGFYDWNRVRTMERR